MPIDRRHALQVIASGCIASSCTSFDPSRDRTKTRTAARFLRAVREGRTAQIKAMLTTHEELVATCDDRGRSAFVLAHLHGQRQLAALLLARLRARNARLDIVEATLAEDWKLVESLVRDDPSLLHATHPIGGTALYAGALVNSRSLWRLRALGFEPDHAAPDGSGWTAARAAMDCPSLTGARDSASDLLGNGADVNARQARGDSILHGAVRRKSSMLVRLALRKGADVNARDADGRSAKDLAAELAWSDGVRLLARHRDIPRDHRASRFAFDANRKAIERPDIRDLPRELQSQITGASHMNLPRLRELVGKDSRRTWSMSTDDELAIEACAHIGRRDIIRFHLDLGAPLSLPTAIALGDREHAKWLLEHDANLIHERGAHDFPLMWYAAFGGGSIEMAELLLGHGAQVDQESNGTTALHCCVLRNHIELAHYLLERGASPRAVGFKWSREGQTPLQLARARKRPRLIDLLQAAS